MPEDHSFQDLIRRVRAGDDAGAAELVRTYGPEIRRAIRVRLTDPRLHRLLDSVDICQSVLANFFARAASGQFELEQPEQLVRLLMRMAQNNLKDHVRREQADKRDVRRVNGDNQKTLETVADRTDTPSQIVAGKEILQKIYSRLSDEERYVAEQHSQGRNWTDLAHEVGCSPEALRKRVARSIERAAEQFGLKKQNHE